MRPELRYENTHSVSHMKNWNTFRNISLQCLCPSGNGVYTVNTAKERKQDLHKALYGQTENVEILWQKNLEHLINSDQNAVILGVASDCGGGILRGANWGPLFLRNTLLTSYPAINAFDLGDVRVIPHLLHDKYLNEQTINNCRRALYNNASSDLPVSPLSITEKIAHHFYATFKDKGLFGIGGDHSVSYPLTKAYLQAKRDCGIKTAIIHFDAHTDLLVERLGIDICFGSWCTHILEYLPATQNLIQIGIRSSKKDKIHWEKTFGIKQYWAEEVKNAGAQAIAEHILQQLKRNQVDELYVSFDIDSIDAKFVSATGTPEPNGLTPEDAQTIIEVIAAEYPITAADMMEIAPFVNTQGDAHEQRSEPASTLKVGADISALLINAITNKH